MKLTLGRPGGGGSGGPGSPKYIFGHFPIIMQLNLKHLVVVLLVPGLLESTDSLLVFFRAPNTGLSISSGEFGNHVLLLKLKKSFFASKISPSGLKQVTCREESSLFQTEALGIMYKKNPLKSRFVERKIQMNFTRSLTHLCDQIKTFNIICFSEKK